MEEGIKEILRSNRFNGNKLTYTTNKSTSMRNIDTFSLHRSFFFFVSNWMCTKCICIIYHLWLCELFVSDEQKRIEYKSIQNCCDLIVISTMEKCRVINSNQNCDEILLIQLPFVAIIYKQTIKISMFFLLLFSISHQPVTQKSTSFNFAYKKSTRNG